MIIQTDFIIHWKTKGLAVRIGREAAIVALLSLWGHCEKRKLWELDLTPLKLAGICDYSGDAQVLLDTMEELRILDDVSLDGSKERWYRVHGWAEINSSLVGKWHYHAGKGAEWHPRGYLVKPNDKSSDRTKERSSDTTIGWDGIREERISEVESPPLVGIEEACEESHSQSFDNFWKKYPLKAGKSDALKSFKRQKLASKLDTILASLEICIASESWQSEGGKYIPYPATWLNRGGWEDELPPASGTHSTVKPSFWPQKNGGAGPIDLPTVYDERMREPSFDWKAVMLEIYEEPNLGIPWGHVEPDVRKEVVAHWMAKNGAKSEGGGELR